MIQNQIYRIYRIPKNKCLNLFDFETKIYINTPNCRLGTHFLICLNKDDEGQCDLIGRVCSWISCRIHSYMYNRWQQRPGRAGPARRSAGGHPPPSWIYIHCTTWLTSPPSWIKSTVPRGSVVRHLGYIHFSRWLNNPPSWTYPLHHVAQQSAILDKIHCATWLNSPQSWIYPLIHVAHLSAILYIFTAPRCSLVCHLGYISTVPRVSLTCTPFWIKFTLPRGSLARHFGYIHCKWLTSPPSWIYPLHHLAQQSAILNISTAPRSSQVRHLG